MGIQKSQHFSGNTNKRLTAKAHFDELLFLPSKGDQQVILVKRIPTTLPAQNVT